MATIQVRTNEKTKKAAQKILKELGIDLSAAINMYLVQIIMTKGIPFQILTENGYTPGQERKMLEEIEWVKKHGKGYTSTQEMFDDILSE